METATTAVPNTHRESWDSLSSTFAHLEVSFSQDSSYGSDEVSVTSNVSSNTSAPLQSNTSSYNAKRESQSVRPALKSILKNSISDLQDEDDEESDSDDESGYGSDDIDNEYDALSEDEGEGDDDEEDDDDMSDFSVWDDDTVHNVPETQQDHTDSFDDSFIGFEASVRFDPKVQYIETPDTTDLSEDDEESGSHSEMTVHEMMLLAMQSSSLQGSVTETGEETVYDDDVGDGHETFFRANAPRLEDFTRDAVEVDQHLFVAYMNGIHLLADSKNKAGSTYKTYIHTQADNIRLGHETESMHPDDHPCMYLDLILNHVIGVFRNLLTEDELNGLIALRKEDTDDENSSQETANLAKESSVPNAHQALLDKIEGLLLERLSVGLVDVLPDELSFFAGSIAHALGTQDLPAIE